MKFTNKQAINTAIATEANFTYLPTADSQIRAFTVHNPTEASIEFTVSISGKIFVKKTLTAGATEVIASLFNHQVNKDEPMALTGLGANVIVTVVEITE